MLGSSGLVGSSGEGGSSAAHEGESRGTGAEAGLVGSSGSSSIMSGDDEKGPGVAVGAGAIELFEGDRSVGGNRWPRQETIALLQIRSDMDGIFRDSSLKGPLWEEVSRKLAELGYHRSAKKCKEKFENVYKYHKRTKDGRVGKADGKTYRFFDQLEALEQHHSSPGSASHLPPLPPVTPRAQSQPPAQAAVPVTMVIPAGTNSASVTVPSSPHPISVVHSSVITTTPPPHQVHQQQMNVVHVNSTNQIPPQPQVIQQQQHQQQHHPMPANHSAIQMENTSSPSATPSSSSSTSSDEELLGRRKRKRKWKDFFERLMKEVIDKQEELQNRFLEAVEKREHDRLVREEAWKMQEMARLNREHEILVQERSMAAAKDAALIAFLQKLSDQQQIPLSIPVQVHPPPPPPPPSQPQIQTPTAAHAAVPVVTTPIPQPKPQQVTQTTQPQQTQSQPQPQPQAQPRPQVTQVQLVQESPVSLPPPQPQQQILHPQPLTQIMPPQQQVHQQALMVANTIMDLQKTNNGESHLQASSSRWPKAEVQALIKLRTNLDQKYQENGPKGPLWEEISASMKKLGYNRNAKRCKEKWENINKYFKKVKESNKKRPEDSKTCPYFHQLDALYREKNKMEISSISPNSNPSYNPSPNATYAQQMKPENLNTMGPIMAQPEQQWPNQQGQDHGMEDAGSENESDEDGDEDDDDEQGSGGYEIVANNNNAASTGGSMSTTATTTAE